MALSNWLTRQEWNGAYTLYMCEALDRRADYPTDLSTLLLVGICLMAQAGYREWGGISVPDPHDPSSVRKSEQTRYGAEACMAEGDNSACLVEQMMGEFDPLARLREFREWAATRPELDLQPYGETLARLEQALQGPEEPE